MKLKQVIVVLYGKEKHELIAGGIKAHMSGFSKEYDVVAIHDEDFTPSYSAVANRKFYAFCQRNANWLYKVYSSANEKKYLKFFNKQRKERGKEVPVINTDKLMRKVAYVRNIVTRFKPVAMVCLTPQSLSLALQVREMYKFNLQVVAYIVDFGLDLRFLDIRCDKYMVSNEEIKKNILKYGIGEDKVLINGAPYAAGMLEKLDREKCREELGIRDDKPIVTLSGGMYGALCIIDDYNKIVDNTCDFHFFALTGGNKKLSALMHAKSTGKRHVEIMDKTDMNVLLAATDVFVTTPTTQNLLMGLIRGCLVVAISPLSMVEKRNFAYFRHSEIGIAAKNSHNTSLAVSEMLLEEKEKKATLLKSKGYLNGIPEGAGAAMKMLTESGEKGEK